MMVTESGATHFVIIKADLLTIVIHIVSKSNAEKREMSCAGRYFLSRVGVSY